MDHQIADSIVKFLTRKESPEDIKRLKEWLDIDSANRDELKQWLKTWDIAEMADNSKAYRHDEAYQRFLFRLKRETKPQKITKNQNMSLYYTIRRIAAVFVISFSLGVCFHYFWIDNRSAEPSFVEYIVPLGSKSEIILPDGSVVWLNAGSNLRYPVDYGKTTRDLHLTGEGYFKVAKQADIPFTVYTPLMKVKALGTEFNVKAYPEEATATTMLVAGEVVVEKGETETNVFSHPVILKPGQMFSVGTQTDYVNEEDVNIRQNQPDFQAEINMVRQLAPTVFKAEITWKEKNWRIESEELQSLSVKLERRYDVHIQVDDQLKNYRFTGTIMDESLEQVLYAMQFTAPILFRIDGKNVYINIDPKKMNTKINN